MESFLMDKYFFKKSEILGSISDGEFTLRDAHVEIEFSLIEPGKIVGQIIGQKNKYEQIKRLFYKETPLKFHGKDLRFPSKKYSSDKVRVYPPPKMPAILKPKITYIVAQLVFDDLKITTNLGVEKTSNRYLNFHLTGHTRFWGIVEDRCRSFHGKTETRVINSNIELDEKFPFTCEVRPWYFYDKNTSPVKYELTTNVPSINFETNKTLSQLSNKSFIQEATGVADDLVLLISFLSKKSINWYNYQFQAKKFINYRRITKQTSFEGHDDYSIFILNNNIRKFIKLAFTNLRDLRANDFDLRMPITYYVSANEKEDTEEAFTTLFLSLEKLKDLFANKQNINNHLSSNQFRKLKDNIKKIIEDHAPDTNTFKSIYGKIGELNRPSLNLVLRQLAFEYKVEWKDLYPPKKNLENIPFVSLRNKLFHSSTPVNFDLLVKETLRLQAFIERLLLSILGWYDLSEIPPVHRRRWLTSS